MALSELVKNSYDADAENVRVEFVETPSRQIRITDDGHGMALGEIEKGWLVLGTPLKRAMKKSKLKKRQLVGSMGIGRLAAFSISESISLSTSSGNGELHSLDMALGTISTAESLLDATVRVRTVTPLPHIPRGTTIILNDPKWWPDEPEERQLRQKLTALCGPEITKDFKITLTIRGKDYPLEPEKDLPKAPIVVVASVKKSGYAHATIRANRALYLGEESVKRDGWEFDSDEEFNHIREVSMRASWYPIGERPSVQYWKLAVREEVDDAIGVKVYRDGLRVLPYGEPGFDWLELEKTYVARGATGRNPRPGSVVGWMFCSLEKNPGLQDTANREGLIDGPATRELKKFGKWVFEKVSEVRRELEPVIARTRERKVDDLNVLKTMIGNLKRTLAERKDMVFDLEQLDKLLEAYQSQTELASLYRDRLTSGALVSVVMHDIGVALKPTRSLVSHALKTKCESKEHDEVLHIVDDLVPRIVSAYDLLRGSGRSGEYRATSFEIKKVVEGIVEKMTLVFSARRTEIVCKCEDTTVKMRGADLWAVVVNLLVNAATSSEFAHARHRQFPANRKISLTLKSEGNDLVVECEDNGPGLPDKPEGWIWIPYNSTRSGGGSGLGLYIVADIVDWYGGHYSAGEAKRYTSGSLFRIKFPEVVLDAGQ